MDDIDDEDDQPRVVYVDSEREGRLARYAAPNTQERERDAAAGAGGAVDGVGTGGCRATVARSSHSAGAVGGGEGGGGVGLSGRGVRAAGGAALWASDDESEGVAPSLLNEEDDDFDVEYVAPLRQKLFGAHTPRP